MPSLIGGPPYSKNYTASFSLNIYVWADVTPKKILDFGAFACYIRFVSKSIGSLSRSQFSVEES